MNIGRSLGLFNITNANSPATPRPSQKKRAPASSPRSGAGCGDTRDAASSQLDSSTASAASLDVFCTPGLYQPPQPMAASSSAGKLITRLQSQLSAAEDEAEARAVQVRQARAALGQEQRDARGCEDELRSEVAAMQQIATERECQRIRLQHEIVEAVKIANLGVQEADDERAAREHAEAALHEERRRREAAEQRLHEQKGEREGAQQQSPAATAAAVAPTETRNPETACAALDEREAQLAAAEAQVHLRETAVDAQRHDIERQREALVEQRHELEYLGASRRANLEQVDTRYSEMQSKLDVQRKEQQAALRDEEAALVDLREDIEWRTGAN